MGEQSRIMRCMHESVHLMITLQQASGRIVEPRQEESGVR